MKFKPSRVRPGQLVAVGVFLMILFIAQWARGRTLLTGKHRMNRGVAYRGEAAERPLALGIAQGIIGAAWVKRDD